MTVPACQAAYRFVVSDSVYHLGVHNPVACVINNVHVTKTPSQALTEEIKTLMQHVKEDSEQLLSTAEVQGFRTLFAKMGYADLTPAGERVFTFFADKGFKTINNIVDAYNIVAVENAAGLGMHDAAAFVQQKAPLHIWRAEGMEKIIPFGERKPRKVKKGDMVYGLKEQESTNLMAWLGQRDKDSDKWKVTETTTSLLFVILGNANTTEEHNKTVCDRTFNLIKLTCPEATMEMVEVVKPSN